VPHMAFASILRFEPPLCRPGPLLPQLLHLHRSNRYHQRASFCACFQALQAEVEVAFGSYCIPARVSRILRSSCDLNHPQGSSCWLWRSNERGMIDCPFGCSALVTCCPTQLRS